MLYKSYFSTKLSLSMLVGVMAAVAFPSSLAMATGFHSYDSVPCYDITGKTIAVSVGGVNNAGILDFDDVGVPADQQACLRMNAVDKTKPDHLEGWVWTDNLGWVSLYCGADQLNLGAACGSQQYSVKFAVTGTAPDYTSVALYDYAWGDNIGWISFKDVSTSLYQLKTKPSGSDRGLVDSSDNYTWADSIGWMNWSGVQFDWIDKTPPVPDPNVLAHVSVCSSDEADTVNCNYDLDGTYTSIPDYVSAYVPEADFSSVYWINVAFSEAGINLPDTSIESCSSTSMAMTTTSATKPYCALLSLVWDDDVDLDQTVSASQKQDSPSSQYDSVNAGAVKKPLDFTLGGADFTYNGAQKLWQSYVKSYAPTSDQNSYEGMSNEKFYYPETVSGYDISKFDQNLLKLKAINLLFFKYADTVAGTPGKCIYGTFDANTGSCVSNNFMVNGGSTLGFKPLVLVKTLAYQQNGNPQNFISVSDPSAELKFLFGDIVDAAAINPVVKVLFGLNDQTSYDLKYVDSFPKAQASEGADFVDMDNTISTPNDLNISAQLFSKTQTPVLDSTSGPYVYTKVSYKVDGKDVSFWGPKLPRIKAGLLLNPVAKVQGNVYLTDFYAKSTTKLNSLGNVSSNLRRETIMRNVAKYLNGFNPNNIVESPVTVSTGSTASIVGLSVLQNDAKKVVYYMKNADLTIDCNGTDCDFDKNATFIVENGNIFVKSNIKAASGKQVGLIALRNLEGNVQDEGMLYLDKNANWLSGVQIYLDRVMQSYDSSAAGGYDSNGFWTLAEDDSARQDRFANQLVIEGTIASMNGVGNASRITATDETGAAVTSGACQYNNVSGNICRARVVDLNYLRYYGPGLMVCSGMEGSDGTAEAGVPMDQKLAQNADPSGGCNPTSASYLIDASSLYNPEAQNDGDLVDGGGKGSSSGYFSGKSKILENQYPVNFFYQAISKDLGGFEVDQSFNPL